MAVDLGLAHRSELPAMTATAQMLEVLPGTLVSLTNQVVDSRRRVHEREGESRSADSDGLAPLVPVVESSDTRHRDYLRGR